MSRPVKPTSGSSSDHGRRAKQLASVIALAAFTVGPTRARGHTPLAKQVQALARGGRKLRGNIDPKASIERRFEIFKRHLTWVQETEVSPESAPLRVVIHNMAELLTVLDKFKARYVFTGYGSSRQYQSMRMVLDDLEAHVDHLDKQHGKRNWIAIFGGDPYDAHVKDVSAILHELHKTHYLPILAVRNLYHSGNRRKEIKLVYEMEDPSFVVRFDPRTIDGQKMIDVNVVRAWGGVHDGKPRGPASVYLGEDVLRRKLIDGFISVGGGKLALQELQYAADHKIPITYFRAQAAAAAAGSEYGPVDDWYHQKYLPTLKLSLSPEK